MATFFGVQEKSPSMATGEGRDFGPLERGLHLKSHTHRPLAANQPSARAARFISMAGMVQFHRSVLESSIEIVGHVSAEDLERPTPCAAWTLRQLLGHMIGQNYGYATAADGGIHDRAVFADRPVGDHPAAANAASARQVLAAFGAPSLAGTTMYLPEVRGGMTLSAPMAIGFNLVDAVAHGWDVAKSLGISADFDESALRVALKIAEAVPADARSFDDLSPFLPAVLTESTSLLDQVVANLGRSPDWKPPL
jgi:uncharacterized protein (TIGR03086 family)